jgi:ribokinase
VQPGPDIDALVFSTHDLDEKKWASRIEQRARLQVRTEGACGGRWWGSDERSGRWEAVPPPGQVRDAYGCGDSFAAGFTFALARGSSVTEAAAMGAQCGARCLTQAGAP